MKTAKAEPTCDPIVTRIEQTLKFQKKTKKELLQHLGLRETNFTNWKYRNGKSYMKYIDGIAEYLGVTVNYLIYGVDQSGQRVIVSESEQIMLEKYRMLDAEKKNIIQSLMEMIS